MVTLVKTGDAAGVTVAIELAVNVTMPSVAAVVMVAVPKDTPVTKPVLFTVATAVLLEVKDKVGAKDEPFWSWADTVSCSVPPTITLNTVGFTDKEESVCVVALDMPAPKPNNDTASIREPNPVAFAICLIVLLIIF
jgi:hypothetical protein